MARITHHLPGPVWRDGRRGRLDGIATDRPARGRGHGRRIVDGPVACLDGLGIACVQPHASADGEPAYRAAGFVLGRCPLRDRITPPAPEAPSAP